MPTYFEKIVLREISQIRAEIEVFYIYMLHTASGATPEKKKTLRSIISKRSKKLYGRLLKEMGKHETSGNGHGPGYRRKRP